MAQIDTTPNVVYRGQIIRVQVPQYSRSSGVKTQASNSHSGLRSCATQCHAANVDVRQRHCSSLLEVRNRYHSESDLVEAIQSADDEPTLQRPRQTKEAHRKVAADHYVPRTIVLRKNGGTFGFLLCGTTSNAGSLHGLSRPTPDHPASQYFDSVQKGSVADNAGLRTGDFLLEINGENVTTATHSHTVQLIRSSGDAICLKIITPPRRRLDRPEHLTVGWQCLPSGPSKDRVAQRNVNKTPCRNITPSSQTAEGLLQPAQQTVPRLTTARSMPDLTAAEDHTQPYENIDNWTGKVREALPNDDYRDRVLYELTSQLRPTSGVTQPLDVSSAQLTDDDRTTPHNQAGTRPADHSTSPQRRPAPPPRGTSIYNSIHPPTPPTVSSLTASMAKSAGSELRELLDHAGTLSRAQHSVTDSPSTAARSTVSGEHLVLPSQLKKVQRSPTNDEASRDNTEETRTDHDALKVNGHSIDTTRHETNAIVEHRSPVPKRPAPPPPSIKTTASPATNGEVNFLVMAEQARQQYILAKLARRTLVTNSAADKSTTSQTNGHHRADVKQAHGLQNAVNSSTTTAEIINGGRNHFTAKGASQEHFHTPNGTSSPHANVKASHQPGPQKGDISVQSLLPRSDTVQTASPPTMPPKRRPRNNSTRVELGKSETQDSEQTVSGVNENGTCSAMDGLLQSTNESKLTDLNVAQETPHQHDSTEHGRRSNAKLIRGKNVQVRRSGASRLSSVIYRNMTANNEHSPMNGHKSCENAEQTDQQLISMGDMGILPPPPDFAD